MVEVQVKIVLVMALLTLLIFSGCITQPVSGNQTGMPNPAAVNCADKGYGYEIRTDASGGQYGVCKYGSSECEEWALYRYECCLTPAECPINCAGTIECRENKCVCIMQEEETGYETINMSAGELLDEQLTECDRWFYASGASGMLTVLRYTWTVGNETNPPDVLPIGGGYENAVLFNDETIRPIIGFALKIYTPSEGHAVSDDCAAAVFKSESTVLDTYEDFSVDFKPGGFGEVLIQKHLDGCTMLNKTNYISGGTTISVYRFACHSIEEE